MSYTQDTKLGCSIAEVPNRATALAKALENLEATVSVLEDRLMSVMHPAEPSPGSNPKETDVMKCVMAENFYQCQKHTDGIQSRVQSLIGRLEI